MAQDVMQLWRRYGSEPELPMPPSDADDELSVAARESPQQWAYFALADAGTDGLRAESSVGSADLKRKLERLGSVPLGRLRMPLNFYQFIAELSSIAVRSGGEVGSQERIWASEVVAKFLVGLFRSVQWARRNTYLWLRMLAPAPMFDFDTAVLIARTLEAPALRTAIKSGMQSFLPEEEDARAYADEFIKAVEALQSLA
jgi:hypothetical protein